MGLRVKPEEIKELARRVRRLGPNRRDPERFHLDKDEIAAELMRLSREAETAAPGTSARRSKHEP